MEQKMIGTYFLVFKKDGARVEYLNLEQCYDACAGHKSFGIECYVLVVGVDILVHAQKLYKSANQGELK